MGSAIKQKPAEALDFCSYEGMRQSGEVKKELPFMQLLNDK